MVMDAEPLLLGISGNNPAYFAELAPLTVMRIE
jgi:hypothetical protein